MSSQSFSIVYPRRVLQRRVLRWTSRALLPLLTRTKITGREHFPRGGPLLVVGNHIAAMEVVLMVVYAPWQMELIGPGDIPPPPVMDRLARFHGYIPINRGNVDRVALTKALDVLRQGGILGIFPEGGIWDLGARQAKRGVAWLSCQAQAPILPIGFGGVQGALDAMLRLKRPRLSMNVGPLIPPVTCPPGQTRKGCFQEAAMQVMEIVNSLIPEESKIKIPEIREERFELQIAVLDAGGTVVGEGADRPVIHAQALCKMFYRPAILRIFGQDLHLPVSALQNLDTVRDPQPIADAIEAIMGYLSERNPAFFSYRFGPAEGAAMEAGLRELHDLAVWAEKAGYQLSVTPIRRYHLLGQDQEVVETNPGRSHIW